MVVTFFEDFGRNIIWCSKLLTHFLAAYERSGRAEVDYGHTSLVTTPIEQKVLRLEVPVDDIAAVTVIDG